MKPLPVKCAKCWAEAPCIWHFEGERSWPPSPFEEMPPLFQCPTHGTFSVVDGEQDFSEPDAWVEGPGGQRIPFFRVGRPV